MTPCAFRLEAAIYAGEMLSNRRSAKAASQTLKLLAAQPLLTINNR